MARIVFDIETVGEKFDELDETTKEVITSWIKKTSESEEDYQVALQNLKEGLGFSPLTGEIVALGVLDVDTDKGAVYFQAPGEEISDSEKDGVKFKAMSEKEILEQFWKLSDSSDEFIGFNSRAFDIPFIMIRSAIHGIRAHKDLMAGRYAYQQKFEAKHIDLFDQLTFYGAARFKGSLHLWSRAFGIMSPKAQGVKGEDVAQLYKDHQYLDIAHYNAEDLRATKELYKKWAEYLRF